MGYNLLINGVYWGYNPLTKLLLTSWDIQVGSWEKVGLMNRLVLLKFPRILQFTSLSSGFVGVSTRKIFANLPALHVFGNLPATSGPS